MRAIVFGLDGASFNLLKPLIEAGKLPNIERILRRGMHSELESCLPPVTSPNWKCYSTGKNPGKLGIFWWENIDVSQRRVYFPRERIYKHREIWDYLGDEGYTVGVINMPLTYPPKKVRGFMVSGGPDAGERNYTYPKEIESRLKRELNYRVNARWLNHIKDNEGKAVEEIYQLIQSRFDAAQVLMDEYQPDFLHLTIFYINTLQHYFWDNEYVVRGWQIIDKNIGKFLESDTNILLMSDHGTNPIEQVFYINSWLEREGYLKLRKRLSTKLLHRFGFTKQNLWKLAQNLRLLGIAKSVIPKSIAAALPTDSGTLDKEGKAAAVDWEQSVAIASGQGPVYLTVGDERREELVRELVQRLANLKNPTTGKRVARRVYTREKVYSGEYLHEAPDIIIDQASGTHIRGGVGSENVFESASGWRAENRRYGIFAACGPDVIIRKKIEKVSILDLAPTILSHFGIPRPVDMDGRVIPCIREDTNKYGGERERIRRIIKRKNL
jgi:predicted AlkP superfamily phosphohydrolase/phosphomutase